MISLTSAANLGEVAHEAFQRFSQSPALWVKGRMYTYAELEELAGAIAGHALAVPSSSKRLAVLADRNEIAYAGILGALLAGMAYVPLNPRFSAARILDILQQADADLVVCDTRCATILASMKASLPPRLSIVVPEPRNTKWLVQHPPANRKVSRANRQDVAYIMFTSGTTGRPKGVPVSHGNALTFLANLRERVSS